MIGICAKCAAVYMYVCKVCWCVYVCVQSVLVCMMGMCVKCACAVIFCFVVVVFVTELSVPYTPPFHTSCADLRWKICMACGPLVRHF